MKFGLMASLKMPEALWIRPAFLHRNNEPELREGCSCSPVHLPPAQATLAHIISLLRCVVIFVPCRLLGWPSWSMIQFNNFSLQMGPWSQSRSGLPTVTHVVVDSEIFILLQCPPHDCIINLYRKHTWFNMPWLQMLTNYNNCYRTYSQEE